jgi:hypothetical protein
MTLTMDELIAQGYCFYIGKTVVKPDLCFCTIRDVRGETVAQSRAMIADHAIAAAIEAIGKTARPEPTTARVKPAMPRMPMPMPKPKGTN